MTHSPDAAVSPPGAWHDPRAHLDTATSPWYRMLTRLYAALVEATSDFYRTEGVSPALMPITVPFVSSPMALGSDSIPVRVELHGELVYLADSMQFQLEFMLRHGLRGAYYIMPTFRGEEPDSTHLNQFFHSEAEIRAVTLRMTSDFIGMVRQGEWVEGRGVRDARDTKPRLCKSRVDRRRQGRLHR